MLTADSPRASKMFDDLDPWHELWGMAEEEEAAAVATGEPSAQAEGRSLAGRDLAWWSLGAGPLPFLDHSSFFYTDPTMPPGHRIYNRLSCFSLEVLHCQHLDTPAPIVAIREIPPAPAPRTCTRRRWLSGQELKAVSALLELSAQAGPCADSRAKQRDP